MQSRSLEDAFRMADARRIATGRCPLAAAGDLHPVDVIARLEPSVKYLVAVFALLLAACITPPTTAEMQAADYGPYPADYQAIVRNYMDDYLNDNESARYKFINQPVKFTTNDLTKHLYGWAACVDVNGKNQYGAYVGYKMHFFLINNGRIIDVAHTDGTIADDVVQNNCGQFE